MNMPLACTYAWIIVVITFAVLLLPGFVLSIYPIPRTIRRILKEVQDDLFRFRHANGRITPKWFMEKNNFAGEGSIIVDVEEGDFDVVRNITWKYISFYDYNPNVFMRARLLPSPSTAYRRNFPDPFTWLRDLICIFYTWHIKLMERDQRRLIPLIRGEVPGNHTRNHRTIRRERENHCTNRDQGYRDVWNLENFIKLMHERTAYHLQNLYRGIRHIEERQKRYLIAGDLYFTEMLLFYLWPYLFTCVVEYKNNTGKRIWNWVRRFVTFFMLFTLNGAILGVRSEPSQDTSGDNQENSAPPVVNSHQLLNTLFQTLSILVSFIPIVLLIVAVVYPVLLLYSYILFGHLVLIPDVIPFGIIFLAYAIIGLAIGVSRSLRSHQIQILRYYYGIINGWGESILRPVIYLLIMGISMSFFTGRIKWIWGLVFIVLFVTIYSFMYMLVHRMARLFGTIIVVLLFFVPLLWDKIIKFLQGFLPKLSYMFLEAVFGLAYFIGFSLSLSLNDMYESWPKYVYKHEKSIQNHFNDDVITAVSNLPVVKQNGSSSSVLAGGCGKDTVPRIFYPCTCIRIRSQYDINFIAFVVFMKIYVLSMLWFLFVPLKRKFMRL